MKRHLPISCGLDVHRDIIENKEGEPRFKCKSCNRRFLLYAKLIKEEKELKRFELCEKIVRLKLKGYSSTKIGKILNKHTTIISRLDDFLYPFLYMYLSNTQNTSWEARYTLGRDPGTGKQIRKSVYGKTQKEVRQKLTQVTAEMDEGTYVEPSA